MTKRANSQAVDATNQASDAISGLLIGGETVFYKDHKVKASSIAAVIKPRAGRLLAHGHGENVSSTVD